MPRRGTNGIVIASVLATALAIGTPTAGATAVGAANVHRHGLGLSIAPHAESMLSPAAIQQRLLALDAPPASVDLTEWAPPVGDQGQVSSCVSWAVDYNAMGWHLRHDGAPGFPLAPMYTYAQLVHGHNVGTYFSDTYAIAEAQGVDTRSDYSQGDYDYTTQPTAGEIANAAHWKLSGVESLPVGQNALLTQTSIKSALASNRPVVIAIPVYTDFFDVSDNTPYDV